MTEVRPDAPSRVRAAGLRMGAARRQVIGVLDGVEGPITAEEVANRLPDVHVSSVYRSLNVLEDLGVVRHVHLAHGPARYELTDVADQVRHLACERCGRDVVVPAALFDDLRSTIEDEYGFVMDSGHFAIPGRCRDCAG
jgi:Fur family ferric uptake transcriptional regulator